MELETFKISCRAIYPNCLFFNNPLGIVVACKNKNGFRGKNIAVFDFDNSKASVCQRSVFVKEGTVYFEVSDERFILELDAIKLNGLDP